MPLKSTDSAGAITRKRIETWVGQAEGSTAVSLSDAANTLTAAQIIDSKIFVQTPTAGRTLTTTTAALLVAAATDYAVGTTFAFSVINLAGAQVITLAGGTGVTIVGVATVAAATSARFAIRIDSATAATVYRLG